MSEALNQASGDNWTMYNGDSCVVLKEIPDNSIDFGIHSPPFANLYIYSESERDLGNCKDYDEFFHHYQFIIKELYRTTVPGRLCAVHCKDLPRYANRDGTTGLDDFPGAIIRAFSGDEAAEIHGAIRILEDRLAKIDPETDRAKMLARSIERLYEEKGLSPTGMWSFHSRATIWKCPVTERERTNNNGLLHKTACRDRSQLRQGMADYLLLFRKPPVGTLMSDKPVTREDGMGFSEYVGGSLGYDPTVDKSGHPSPFARQKNSQGDAGKSIDIWQWYADPVWFDIDQMDVLNDWKGAGSAEDERHICPLQLGLIERAVEIWSNPGDVVLSPFAGFGSEGVGSLRRGRKFVGIELKPEYWQRACRECEKADAPKAKQRKLELV